MTDEEKKAIDILINEIADIVISEYCTHCKICENEDTECYYTKVIDIVYNLVQKQSKEIEELKKPKYVINCKTNEITKLTNDFVSKDKIKAKIEEVKDGTYDAKIVLQSLLEKE